MDTQDHITEHRKGQHLIAEERHDIEPPPCPPPASLLAMTAETFPGRASRPYMGWLPLREA